MLKSKARIQLLTYHGVEVGIDLVVLLRFFGLVHVAVALDDARGDQVAFGALPLPDDFEDAAGFMVVAVFAVVEDHAVVLVSKPHSHVVVLPIQRLPVGFDVVLERRPGSIHVACVDLVHLDYLFKRSVVRGVEL